MSEKAYSVLYNFIEMRLGMTTSSLTSRLLALKDKEQVEQIVDEEIKAAMQEIDDLAVVLGGLVELRATETSSESIRRTTI